MIYPQTIYELTFGGSTKPEEKRYFPAFQYSDAAQRFSEELLKLDQDVSCGGAYVHLKRLPDSIYPEGASVLGWTKISNERPIAEGALTVEELL